MYNNREQMVPDRRDLANSNMARFGLLNSQNSIGNVRSGSRRQVKRRGSTFAAVIVICAVLVGAFMLYFCGRPAPPQGDNFEQLTTEVSNVLGRRVDVSTDTETLLIEYEVTPDSSSAIRLKFDLYKVFHAINQAQYHEYDQLRVVSMIEVPDADGHTTWEDGIVLECSRETMEGLNFDELVPDDLFGNSDTLFIHDQLSDILR